jgi:hypothetical protein
VAIDMPFETKAGVLSFIVLLIPVFDSVLAVVFVCTAVFAVVVFVLLVAMQKLYHFCSNAGIIFWGNF